MDRSDKVGKVHSASIYSPYFEHSGLPQNRRGDINPLVKSVITGPLKVAPDFQKTEKSKTKYNRKSSS